MTRIIVYAERRYKVQSERRIQQKSDPLFAAWARRRSPCPILHERRGHAAEEALSARGFRRANGKQAEQKLGGKTSGSDDR